MAALVPGGMPWCRPWPFLIEWATPDATRLAWEGNARHPNGAESVSGIDLAVHAPAATMALLGERLGLPHAGASFRAGDCVVRVVPTETAEGPVAVHIRVASIVQARAALTAAQVQFEERDDRLQIAPAEACGAQLALVG